MLTTVSNTAGLQSALASAQGGDTIQLAKGIYDNVVIQNLSFSQQVTITSADPFSDAILTSLTVRNAQGLVIQNLEFAVDPTKPDNSFLVYGSKNIDLRGLNIHGRLDSDSSNDRGAVMIRVSDDVTVTNSEFHELFYGLQHLDSTNILISGNYFHDIRLDGIRGGGTSDIVITKNLFSDFYPLTTATVTDHADAVQFWTTNTTTSARNISVTENMILRGAGRLMQGIFITDQVKQPYVGVTVADNILIGTLWNGITVMGASDVEVRNNQVMGLPDQRSWIRISDTTNARLVNNKATTYELATTGLTESGDVTILVPTDGGRAAILAWLASHALTARDGSWAIPDTSVISTAADAALRIMEAARVQLVAVNGTSGADKLTVDPVRDTRVEGGDGADTLTGGGLGHNTLSGGGGNDTYFVNSAHDLANEVANGGVDLVITTIDFILPDNFEGLRLSGAATSGVGNALANTIQGADGADYLDGAANDDSLQGLGGADTLIGDAGADTLDGGDGDDQAYGGADNDRLTDRGGSNYLRGEEGDDSVQGGSGFDDINGNMGADTCAGGTGNDWVVGGKENDRLLGEDGDDLIYGNLGDDTCDGGNGADTMRGGQGADSLLGGAGNDYLSGDRGDDTVSGGAGADMFHSFSEAGIDRVLDFSSAQGDQVWLDLGTTYTVAQQGVDTIISMGGGGMMILVGVPMSSLTSTSIFLA